MDVGRFEEFFHQMRPRLMRFNQRWVDVDAANEIAVEALRSIWDKDLPAPGNAREQRQLESLAYRICEGLLRNAQRGHRRRLRLAHAVQADHDVRPTVVESPEERNEQSARVRDALAKLPEKEREVISLLICGYTIAEIAEILETTPGAVSMRLRRARTSLRRLVEGASDD
ncbi:MAG: sigma-70 family polymerase sigma factor [Marmoricola sp.]|nr:sigma-70 family polymerase sigma factor [Marmoricola sp.]